MIYRKYLSCHKLIKQLGAIRPSNPQMGTHAGLRVHHRVNLGWVLRCKVEKVARTFEGSTALQHC
eukprot:scaffold661648_cov83-Prasinocladus_malaysianus.AAC.1